MSNVTKAGSYYLTGLAVECALKAILAQGVREYDFPDKAFAGTLYTHNIQALARSDGSLWQDLQTDIQADSVLQTNWETVLLWNNQSRYKVIDEPQAHSLYAAVTDAHTGVINWIWRRVK